MNSGEVPMKVKLDDEIETLLKAPAEIAIRVF